MEAIKENKKGIGDAKLGFWRALFASRLPLWLFSFAVMAEGFLKRPLSINLAIVSFFLAIAVSIVPLWRRTFEVLLCSLLPFIFLLTFDEISTSHKTPFILLCALILSAGIFSYNRALSRSVRLAWLVLKSVFIATWVLAMRTRTTGRWSALYNFLPTAAVLTRLCPPRRKGNILVGSLLQLVRGR